MYAWQCKHCGDYYKYRCYADIRGGVSIKRIPECWRCNPKKETKLEKK